DRGEYLHGGLPVVVQVHMAEVGQEVVRREGRWCLERGDEHEDDGIQRRGEEEQQRESARRTARRGPAARSRTGHGQRSLRHGRAGPRTVSTKMIRKRTTPMAAAYPYWP